MGGQERPSNKLLGLLGVRKGPASGGRSSHLWGLAAMAWGRADTLHMAVATIVITLEGK